MQANGGDSHDAWSKDLHEAIRMRMRIETTIQMMIRMRMAVSPKRPTNRMLRFSIGELGLKNFGARMEIGVRMRKIRIKMRI